MEFQFLRRNGILLYLSKVFLCATISVGAYAAIDEDAVCFPLYRENGAIPGTGISCELMAASASVNLATNFCTASSGTAIIKRYWGKILKI